MNGQQLVGKYPCAPIKTLAGYQVTHLASIMLYMRSLVELLLLLLLLLPQSLFCLPAGYLLSLLASLLLYMHPLRGCLAEMLWPEDMPAPRLTTAAAAANAAAASSLQATSSSAFAVPGSQQQQQQQQFDQNPLDDSRVLLAFDSMDQPAFGSWKPGEECGLNSANTVTKLLYDCYITQQPHAT
jgi:hypothetical protein